MKVLAITGIRSEYDIIYPVLRELESDDFFELGIVVSSAHLSHNHGYTIENIKKDGFTIIDKIDCLFDTDRVVQRSKGVGMLVYSLSQTVERYRPDIMIVVGDREESIATAIVGNYTGTLVAHIGGGDPVYGNTDDPIRMAVTKLSHIHFATTELYKNNLIGLSEDRFRVCNSGNPALKNIEEEEYINIIKLQKFLDFKIEKKKYIVLLKHPLSSEMKISAKQMSTTLEACMEFSIENDFKLICIKPNTDPGSSEMNEVTKKYVDNPRLKIFNTLPRKIFVNILRNSAVLVGNSSMGILEAPTYKLPVVNVGNRQMGRLNAGNVVFVPYVKKEIQNAIINACFNKDYIEEVNNIISPYGNGDASKKIKKFLKKIDLDNNKWLLKKNLC